MTLWLDTQLPRGDTAQNEGKEKHAPPARHSHHIQSIVPDPQDLLSLACLPVLGEVFARLTDPVEAAEQARLPSLDVYLHCPHRMAEGRNG